MEKKKKSWKCSRVKFQYHHYISARSLQVNTEQRERRLNLGHDVCVCVFVPTLSYCVWSTMLDSSERTGRQCPAVTPQTENTTTRKDFNYITLPPPKKKKKNTSSFSPPSPRVSLEEAREQDMKKVRKQEIKKKRTTALVFSIRWKSRALNALLTLWVCFSFILTPCKDLGYTDELNNNRNESKEITGIEKLLSLSVRVSVGALSSAAPSGVGV